MPLTYGVIQSFIFDLFGFVSSFDHDLDTLTPWHLDTSSVSPSSCHFKWNFQPIGDSRTMRESIVETLTRPAMPGLCFSCHFRNRNRRNCTLQGNGGCRANIVQLLRKRHQSVHTHIYILYILLLLLYIAIYIYMVQSRVSYTLYMLIIHIYIFLSRYLYKNQRVSNLFYNEYAHRDTSSVSSGSTTTKGAQLWSAPSLSHGILRSSTSPWPSIDHPAGDPP